MASYLIPVTADGGFIQAVPAGETPVEYATESDITTAISNLVDTAPTALNTLNELAAALGDDANYAATITTALGNKADTSSLSTVATSGSYTDLSNKPTLFSGSYTDLTSKPTIPTNTNQLTNGAGFITSSDISGKQATLVSGTNIKSINGESLLGSGDITIGGGGGTDYSTALKIALGSGAGATTQSNYAVAVGYQAGNDNQNPSGVAVGNQAGKTSQGQDAISIGFQAGYSYQSGISIAIGSEAGKTSQSSFSVAMGSAAGQTSQGELAVAIGPGAGNSYQGARAIAIGRLAGSVSQGSRAIAIGEYAGYSNQAANSIALYAESTGTLDPTTSGFFVSPVRSDATPTNIIYYNTTTKEMTYGAAPSGGSGGGGSAAASDYFSYQSFDMSTMPGSSLDFNLPVASGPVFGQFYSDSTGIIGLAPTSWSTLSWTPSPPGGPSGLWYRIAPDPSPGVQSMLLDTWSYGTVRIIQWVLESESTSHQIYRSGGVGSGWQTSATVTNPMAMFEVSWMTAGYCYGSISAPDSSAWASMQQFVAAEGVTIYISTDSNDQTVYFRCPGSVWNATSTFTIGTYPSGGWSQIYITAYFFGI